MASILLGSRFWVRVLVFSVLAGSAGLAQAPTFDAVSIKVNKSGDQGARFGGRPGGIEVRNNTLRNIVRNVWNLNNLQIVGGPDWINEDRFDILATAAGNPTPPQMMEMAKTMLADRFKLKVHTETRQLPIYALVLARPDGKLGPRMRPSTLDCERPPAGRAGEPPPAPPTPPAPLDGIEIPACGTRSAPGLVTSGGVLLEALTRNMAGMAGRIIVDKTGLTGRFDFSLSFNMDPANTSPDLPSVFAAMQEQLGLKLEAQTGPVEVFVIDSAERPSEN
jgi:uncharacterized protein (TIGR03435 family)